MVANSQQRDEHTTIQPSSASARTASHTSGNPSTSDAAMAGAMSGFIARALLQPLDVLKIRMQLAETKPGGAAHPSLLAVTTNLYRHEGLYGMWKGHVPAQLLSVGYGAVQFAVYAVMCEAAGVDPSRKVKSGGSTAVFSWHFILGGLAGMAATAANHPLDTIRTRVVFNRARIGVARVALDTIKREGISGLYRGVGPSVVQIFPYSGFQFGYYRLLQHALGGIDWMQPYSAAVSGSLAGFLAKLHILPIDFVKKRLQVQGLHLHDDVLHVNTSRRYTGFVHCVRTVLAHEGALAFFRGAFPAVLKSASTTGVTFAAYEYVLDLLAARRHTHDNTPPVY